VIERSRVQVLETTCWLKNRVMLHTIHQKGLVHRIVQIYEKVDIDIDSIQFKKLKKIFQHEKK